MRVLIESKTLELTTALRAYIELHSRKLLSKGKHIEQVMVVVETISRKKNELGAAIARIQIKIPGKDVVVEKRSYDLYQAITDSMAIAARHLRKAKEKRLRVKRQWSRPTWQLASTAGIS